MKMLHLIGVLILCYAFQCFSSDEKVYSEEQFQNKLHEELLKKIDTIKKQSVSSLTKELLEKEDQIRQRELEIKKNEDQLDVMNKELTLKILSFENQQKKFLGCVEKNEQESKGRVGQVVEMIGGMKPNKAAEILSVQESDIAVQILQLMDPKKASKIFNFMDKEVSARLQKQYLNMKR